MEREYNVPLRREWLKVSTFKRAKKAVTGLRSFIVKHMKSEEVILETPVNLAIWSRGMRNPPHHIKVRAVKDDKGVVRVTLPSSPKSGASKETVAAKDSNGSEAKESLGKESKEESLSGKGSKKQDSSAAKTESKPTKPKAVKKAKPEA